jgi:hypothetical protein
MVNLPLLNIEMFLSSWSRIIPCLGLKSPNLLSIGRMIYSNVSGLQGLRLLIYFLPYGVVFPNLSLALWSCTS